MDELLAEIGDQLPNSKHFKLWYCQTKPTKVKPLITTKKNIDSIDSYKIRHFFQLLDEDDLIVFGIEIFVYLQVYDQYVDEYIFISKCDTIGINESNFKVGSIISKILKYLINYNINQYKIKKSRDIKTPNLGMNHQTGYILDILLKRLKNQEIVEYKKTRNLNSIEYIKLPERVNIKLTLFTRASNQYLYPHSSKNRYKHLINGGQLLKWWIRVIDDTINQDWNKTLLIPGGDTSHYLLPGWKNGHIFNQYPNLSAVYSIPLLPDDPKGRFLEHLVVENRYNKVNIEQFYFELGYRQEFRLGDIVGLIGCEASDVNQVNLDNFNLISLKNYKLLINEIKSTSCNNIQDLKNLVKVKIPEINNKFNSKINQYDVVGKKNASQSTHKQSVPINKPVNNLTGLIKRKKVKVTK